jgi:hypothetical protein
MSARVLFVCPRRLLSYRQRLSLPSESRMVEFNQASMRRQFSCYRGLLLDISFRLSEIRVPDYLLDGLARADATDDPC